ncbi:hypothetical protein [Arcticibacter eurypsychrophilus]|uniref:hypothetical protein n=1 Tax=Arcticibacter eurypsychrophilus TaxID=1434752 RepID=UPI00084D8834|nr:hypothetical protein [Arcticibacter eurypsychrophilus]
MSNYDTYPHALYLNLEDPRLYEFEPTDFAILDELIKASGDFILVFFSLIVNLSIFESTNIHDNNYAINFP